MNRNQIVAEKLKELRGQCNKTQQEIADAIGVKVSAIGMYEAGKRIPKDDIKMKLANYFNVNINEIFLPMNVTFSDRFEERIKTMFNENLKTMMEQHGISQSELKLSRKPHTQNLKNN